MSFYVFVQDDDPLDGWQPLGEMSPVPHVTLLPRFSLDSDRFDAFGVRVGSILADLAPLQVVLAGAEIFTRLDGGQVSVSLVAGDVFPELHGRLLGALVAEGGEVHRSEFTGAGFRAHVSEHGGELSPTMGHVLWSESRRFRGHGEWARNLGHWILDGDGHGRG